ncbi:polysaccharide biosynthesis/export family protein [Roseimicrobium gellanilyticum]|nr:polysaccharide biosynthesis/export family protein [Roseimicrobium gellanilyticum]
MSRFPFTPLASRKPALRTYQPRKDLALAAGEIMHRQLHFAALPLLAVFGFALVGCKSDSGFEQPRPDDYATLPRAAASNPLHQPIRPGDVLEITVQEDPSLGGSFTVRAEGHILMPSVGPRVSVAGLSVPGAEQHIKRLLEQKKLRTATVTLDRVFIAPVSAMADKEQMLVYLTGKVARPGQHMLSTEIGSPLGAYEAIMIAGGLGRFADGKNAHVLRQGPGGSRRKLGLNLDAIAKGEERDLPLRKGDIVVVPEKVFGF